MCNIRRNLRERGQRRSISHFVTLAVFFFWQTGLASLADTVVGGSVGMGLSGGQVSGRLDVIIGKHVDRLIMAAVVTTTTMMNMMIMMMMVCRHINPFSPESDQCQNSPAASQEI